MRLSSISMPVSGRSNSKRDSRSIAANTSRLRRILCRYLARSSRVKLVCSTSSPMAHLLSGQVSNSHTLGVSRQKTPKHEIAQGVPSIIVDVMKVDAGGRHRSGTLRYRISSGLDPGEGNRVRSRRLVIGVVVAAVLSTILTVAWVSMGPLRAAPPTTAAQASAPAAPAGPEWSTAWAAAPAAGYRGGPQGHTVRNVVHTTVGGTQVRVRLTNRF